MSFFLGGTQHTFTVSIEQMATAFPATAVSMLQPRKEEEEEQEQQFILPHQALEGLEAASSSGTRGHRGKQDPHIR